MNERYAAIELAIQESLTVLFSAGVANPVKVNVPDEIYDLMSWSTPGKIWTGQLTFGTVEVDVVADSRLVNQMEVSTSRGSVLLGMTPNGWRIVQS